MQRDRGDVGAVAYYGHDLPEASCFAFRKQRRHQLSADATAGPCRVKVNRVLGGIPVSRPQPVGRCVGVAHDVAGTLGHKIGKALADDFKAAPVHVIFARRRDLKGCKPVEDMMRVDSSNRRYVILLARPNGADG